MWTYDFKSIGEIFLIDHYAGDNKNKKYRW